MAPVAEESLLEIEFYFGAFSASTIRVIPSAPVTLTSLSRAIGSPLAYAFQSSPLILIYPSGASVSRATPLVPISCSVPSFAFSYAWRTRGYIAKSLTTQKTKKPAPAHRGTALLSTRNQRKSAKANHDGSWNSRYFMHVGIHPRRRGQY